MSEYVDSLHEVFERFGRIEVRRMFGGHGIYREGRMFALVAGDTLYLKSDAANVAEFDRLALPHFEYQRQGKTMQTSYRQAPADLFEDRDVAAAWASRAWEAALRSGKTAAEKQLKKQPTKQPKKQPTKLLKKKPK